VPPVFLDGLGCVSLVEVRRGLIDRFPVSSSSPSPLSSSAPTKPAAFSFPLPLALAPASRSTVVLVDEAEEEDRARFELPPAAETAVDDPEENDGDRSRVRRVDEREDGGLACTFFPTASLVRSQDVPAKATSSFATVWVSGGSEEVTVSGLGVASAFPRVSFGVDIVDLACDGSDGPALFSVDMSDGSSAFASDPLSFSSVLEDLIFLRGGSGTSEGSLVLSS